MNNIRNRRVLRLALGTTLAVFVSQSIGWTLSYIAPILAMVILAIPVSRPPAKFFLLVVAAITVSVYGSMALLPLLLHYKLAGLVVVSLALFHTFYITACGKPAVLSTLLTIGITLTVAVGSVSIDALLLVAAGVVFGALAGALIAWLMHVLLPDPPHDVPAKPTEPVANNPVRRAMRSLLIVLPVTVWFLFSPASASNAAVMIKIASMGQESSAQGTRNAARSLLVSTLAGGIAAVIGWEILSIWPSLMAYTLVMATACLWFAGRIFAGYGLAPDGATWNYGLLTMIIVLAPAALDSQFGSAANVSFYGRLMMFAGASLYGVAAVYVFDAFWSDEQRTTVVARGA